MKNFSEFPINPFIQQSLTELGFSDPTPIQAQALPILLDEPTDFLGLAATGTGKTAAYSIPMLQKLDPKLRAVQCLVLCPTRELALQVCGQIELLGKHQHTRAVPIYGGSSFEEQVRGLRRGAPVAVGTPGRILDHLNRKTLDLRHVTTLILDEADEMISMGFKEELEEILKSVSTDCRKWLFSATMDKQVSRVANAYLSNPKQVQANRTEMLSATVQQIYFRVHESDKPEILCKLIESVDDFYGLIFCQTKSLVIDLTAYMIQNGYKVDSLHGDMDQSARERSMQAFRDRRTKVLVCTDVASRGLDVKDITHVINYSLPRELDNYVHRIGRTARSGKTGVAMNLVTPSHRHLVYEIEKLTKSKMIEGKIPSRKDVAVKKVAQLLTPFSESKNHTLAQDVLSDEWRSKLASMSSDEIAGRFIAMMMKDLFSQREARTAGQFVDRSEAGRRPPKSADPRRDRRRSQAPSFGRRKQKAFQKRSLR